MLLFLNRSFIEKKRKRKKKCLIFLSLQDADYGPFNLSSIMIYVTLYLDVPLRHT